MKGITRGAFCFHLDSRRLWGHQPIEVGPIELRLLGFGVILLVPTPMFYFFPF